MINHTQAECIHTIVIGAGPAGLAAAYALVQQGIIPVVVEKDKTAGGLMRSIHRGGFIMDVGRKELYTRLHKVDALWKEVLGEDYVTYQHREGILYNGSILETNSRWQGLRRGMPWAMVWKCGVDYLWSRLKSITGRPLTYEDYWYGRRGRQLSRILSQRYEEKFKGVHWRDLPPPEVAVIANTSDRTIADRLLGQHIKERKEPIWRHPAKGSGQICDMLEKNIQAAGALLKFDANILAITTSDNRIDTITVAVGSDVTTYRPQHVISSVPAEIMVRLLNDDHLSNNDTEHKQAKLLKPSMSTICVYLFLSESPRFSHTWLKVTSPELKVGRITNFSAFSSQMVPEGMTCLCIEYFCTELDAMLTLKDDELREYALVECASAKLIDRDKCFDHFVLKLPGTKAAINWRDWDNPRQHKLLSFLNGFDNLYYINRPGTDKATYAGLEAASAIIDGDRSIFFKEMSLSIPCWDRSYA